MADYDADIDFLSRELIAVKNSLDLKAEKKNIDTALNYLNVKIKELSTLITTLQVAVDLLKEE